MTIETEESVVLRGVANQHATLMWCPSCRRRVEMVTPERAAQIAGVTEHTIYGLNEEESTDESQKT